MALSEAERKPFLLRCFACGLIFDQNQSRKACTFTCTHCDAMELPWTGEHERVRFEEMEVAAWQN